MTTADKIRKLRDMFRIDTMPWALANEALSEVEAMDAATPAPRPPKTPEVERLERQAAAPDIAAGIAAQQRKRKR